MAMKFVYVLILIPLVSAEVTIFNYKNVIDKKFADADINDLVDRSMPQISEFIVEHGLDPFNLPKAEKDLWVKLPKNTKQAESKLFKANLVLHSGILKHLSNIKRYGNAGMNYEAKLLKLDIGFEFNCLEAAYNFAVKLFFFHLEGRILASTENVRAKFSVTFDIEDTSLYLNKFELEIPSGIKVIIENKNGKVDWIKTSIAKVVTPFLKDTLVKVIQKEGAKAIQKYLDKINKLFDPEDFINNKIMDQYSQILIP